MDFEKLKTSVYISGKRGISNQFQSGCKEQVLQFIAESNLDKYTKDELSKKVNGYPAGTAQHFYKNILKHIAIIQKSRTNSDQ